MNIFIILAICIVVLYLYTKIKKSNKNLVINFGKHSGKRISEISSNYLRWLVENHSNSTIRIETEKELVKRDKFLKENNIIFGIIEAKQKCFKCKKDTKVIALKFYKTYKNIEIYKKAQIVRNTLMIPDDILEIVQLKFPFFKDRYSNVEQRSYIANTCNNINCGVLQGDFYMFEEPDGVFFDIYDLKPNYFIGFNDSLKKLEYIQYN